MFPHPHKEVKILFLVLRKHRMVKPFKFFRPILAFAYGNHIKLLYHALGSNLVIGVTDRVNVFVAYDRYISTLNHKDGLGNVIAPF